MFTYILWRYIVTDQILRHSQLEILMKASIYCQSEYLCDHCNINLNLISFSIINDAFLWLRDWANLCLTPIIRDRRNDTNSIQTIQVSFLKKTLWHLCRNKRSNLKLDENTGLEFNLEINLSTTLSKAHYSVIRNHINESWPLSEMPLFILQSLEIIFIWYRHS